MALFGGENYETFLWQKVVLDLFWKKKKSKSSWLYLKVKIVNLFVGVQSATT